jgi:hypothetical protein
MKKIELGHYRRRGSKRGESSRVEEFKGRKAGERWRGEEKT